MMKIFYSISIILLISLKTYSQTRPALPDPVDIKFYPNPATTQITFDFQQSFNKSYSFQIYNFIGKKVYDISSLSSPKATIDLSDYFRGIYIFQLKDKNGKMVKSGRFQVSR